MADLLLAAHIQRALAAIEGRKLAYQWANQRTLLGWGWLLLLRTQALEQGLLD